MPAADSVDDVRGAGDVGDVELSVGACLARLAAETVGRVGLTSGGLPCILPVRYVLDGETVRFRSAPGSKLRAAQSGDVLAFEVDHFDPETGYGWSVLALGRATVHDGPADASGKGHVVALRCEIVTGRAVQLEV